MTRLSLAIILFFWTIATNGQSASKRVDSEISTLRHSTVDTFLIYTIECSGGLIPKDTCDYKQTHYLLWKQNGNYYLKRYDNCENFKPISLDTANPLAFYLKYELEIDREEIKPPSYIEKGKGNRAVEMITYRDHDCFYDFTFILKRAKRLKRVSDFSMTFEKFDNGRKNRYSNYNKKTKLKALIDKFSLLVLKLDKDKRFEVN